MLSRVAEQLYWIFRYVERAENLARFLEVSQSMALDTPMEVNDVWLPLIDVCADRSRFEELHPGGGAKEVGEYLLRETDNPNAIRNCLAIARENARQIREVIPNEFFEDLNALYLDLEDGEPFWQLPEQEQLQQIRSRCQQLYGIADSTMRRDLSWQFANLGRLIERADKTARILDVKYFLLLPSLEDVGGALDELQWIALLRCASAYQVFRQHTQQPISPSGVAAFLLLDPAFPRSVRYCLNGVAEALNGIDQRPLTEGADNLARTMGLLQAHWNYSRVEEVVNRGLHEVIDTLQQQLNQLHRLIEERYFISSHGSMEEI